MAVDHSLTYTAWSLRNLPHRLRLRDLERLVGRLELPSAPVYADFGCSNGFVTGHVSRWIGAGRTVGLDHVEEHLRLGRELHPTIVFSRVDLNDGTSDVPKCHFLTCLETLEHVGDLDAAISILERSLGEDGQGLISVPIEIGWPGLLKFVVKVLLFGYTLKELPQCRGLGRQYLGVLLTGKRISRFRDLRTGWATHFGFDYRDLDEGLSPARPELRYSQPWVYQILPDPPQRRGASPLTPSKGPLVARLGRLQ